MLQPGRKSLLLLLAVTLITMVVSIGVRVPLTLAEEPSATPTPCQPEALYLGDVTVPENTIVSPGAPIWKVWRLQNNGHCAWGEGYALAFVKGDGMSAPPSQPVTRTVAPGDTLDIGVEMYAPRKPGSHTGWWQMRDPSGASFGPMLAIKIMVQGPTLAIRPSLTPTPLPLASPMVMPTPTPTVEPSLIPTPTPLASPTAISALVSDQFIQHLEKAKTLYLEREYAQAQIELEQSQRFLEAIVQALREPSTLTGDSYINHQYGLQISNPVPGWEFKEIPAEQREALPEGMVMLISIVKTGTPSEERIMVMVLELEKLMPPALVGCLMEDPQSGLRSLAMSAVKNLYVSEVISEGFLTIDGRQAFKVVFRSAITSAGMTDIDLDILKEKYRLVRIMLTSSSQNFEENRTAFDQIISTLKFN